MTCCMALLPVQTLAKSVKARRGLKKMP